MKKNIRKKKSKQKKKSVGRSAVACIAALAVFFCTVYVMKLPAISTSRAGNKLTCVKEEHTHSSECYVTTADLSGHICDPLKEAEDLLERLGITGEIRTAVISGTGISGQSASPANLSGTNSASTVRNLNEGSDTDKSLSDFSGADSSGVNETDKADSGSGLNSGSDAGGDVDSGAASESSPEFDNNRIDSVYSVIPDDDPVPAAQADLDKVYILHTHNEYCYGDEDGNADDYQSNLNQSGNSGSGDLICCLEEMAAHTHDMACCREEKCSDCSSDLVVHCSELALEEHMHDEDCLDAAGNLSCSRPLVIAHTHDRSCFEEKEELVCLLEEYSHSDSCYESVPAEVPGIGVLLKPDGSLKQVSTDDTDADTDDEGPNSGDDSADSDSGSSDSAGSGSDENTGSGSETDPDDENDIDTDTDTGSDPDAGTSSGSGSDPDTDTDTDSDSSGEDTVITVRQDLAGFITSVKATVNGVEVDDGSDLSQIVSPSSSIDFQIEYKLPPNTLKDNSVYFEYRLPDNFVIQQGGIHGDIYKASGEAVGVFSVVTDDKGRNYAYITFTDEKFIAGNIDTDISVGSEISGFLNFSLAAGALESDDTGDTVLTFGTGIGDVTIHIHVPGKEIVSEEDLSVEKIAGTPTADGVIQYTIRISSKNGTAGEVKVTDWISNAVLGGDDKDGNFNFEWISSGSGSDSDSGSAPVVTIIPNWNSDPNSYELTLPPMNPGDEYVFTYEVKVDMDSNTTVWVNNTVHVSSTRSDGAIITDSASTNTGVQTSMISKYANIHWTGPELIDWVITINEAGLDISGFTLSDPMFAEAIGNITITPDPERADLDNTSPGILKLDENGNYTFPEGSTDTYTVSFTTKWSDITLGNHGIVNTATLSKDSQTYTGSYTAWVREYDKDALQKSAGGVSDEIADYTYTDDEGNKVSSKTVNMTWNVKIDAISGTLYPDWSYEDQLYDCEYQWFTWEQIKCMKNSLDASLEKAGLNLVYDLILVPLVEPDDAGIEVNYNTACSSSGNIEYYRPKRYKGFKLVFHNELPRDKSFEFTYSSTARIDTLTDKHSYINEGTLRDSTGSITKTASQSYTPVLSDFVISKTDMRNPDGGDSTEVNYQAIYDSTLDAYVLKWKLNVTVPASYDGKSITIVDELPKGLSLHKLKMAISFLDEPFLWREVSLKDGEHDIAGKSVNLTIHGNRIEFEIPKESLYGTVMPGVDTKIRIEVEAIIDEKIDWITSESGNEYTVSYTNTLTVMDSSNDTIGSDTQTQTVVRHVPNLLIKSSSVDSNNTIEYTLVINPDGDDLIEDGELLTLIDTLTYSYNPTAGAVNVSLVPNSVTLTAVDRAGRKTDLDLNVYTYSYSETRTMESPVLVQGTNVLEFTVPDETKLILKYKYHVAGDTDLTLSVKNGASLSGVSGKNSSTSTSSSVYVKKGSAGANLNSVGFLKVDSNNAGLHLENVRFQLQEYDAGSNTWVDAGPEYKTNSSGEFYVPMDLLKKDKAYRLKEVETAKGYLLGDDFYFYLSTSTGMPVFPSGISARPVMAGQTIYISNEKQTMDLTVMKIWRDQAGKDVTSEKTTGSVTYELWRKIGPASRESAVLNIDYVGWYDGDLRKTENLPDEAHPELVEGSQVTITLHGEKVYKYRLDEVQILEARGCSLVSQNIAVSHENTHDGTCTVDWTFVIQVGAGSNNLIIKLGGAGESLTPSDYQVTAVTAPATLASQYAELEEKVGSEYIIKGSDPADWTNTHKDLEKYPMDSEGNYLKEPDGKRLEYIYYVVEKDINGYTSVVDSSKQNHGLITITNTETGEDFFTLPATGGIGKNFYWHFGLVLMIISLPIVIWRKRKEKLS